MSSKFKFNEDHIKYINQSVLCWLATCSIDHIPNVSPKEIFSNYQESKIIIANIASPQTVKNIKSNPHVCISFIDILIQKGFQMKGKATIIQENHEDYYNMANILLEQTGGKFPFNTITVIEVESVKAILAPRYILYPDTKESDQIKSALSTYNLKQFNS